MAAPANAVDRSIAMVKMNIGRPGDTTLDDYTLIWINQTQHDICNRKNWPFMRQTDTISFSQSDTSQSLPTGFKDEDGVYIVEDDDTFTELEMIDFVDMRRFHDDTTEGKPTVYAYDGQGNILIRPVPDQAYTVRIDYYEYLDDLAEAGASNTLLTNFPEVLETGATYRAFRYLSEFEEAKGWLEIHEMKVKDMSIAQVELELPDEFGIQTRPNVFGKAGGRNWGRSR